MSSESALELAKLLAERKRRTERNRLAAYEPYEKQREFHAAGKTHRERLFMAGNQQGKTLAGSAEKACHLTGRYPDWWDGHEFKKGIRAWAAGETGIATRDSIQKLLVGPPQSKDRWGTGMIPGDAIIDTQPARGVPDLLDSVVVRHGGGGDIQATESVLLLKSYEQGRAKFQADTIDLGWCDEEPDIGIYFEMLTRTNATKGLLFTTFTPLLGMSEMVLRFIQPAADDPGKVDRHITQMTIDDAAHYSPEERAKIIASYPEHEREARTQGIPVLGSGAIFPVADERILCDPVPLVPHWFYLGGMDFGYDHPFAATQIAWDRDADVIYVIAEYRESKKTPVLHAGAIKPWGSLMWAWPHDGLQHDKGSGEALAAQYRAQGLNLLPHHAQHEDGSNGVEAGLFEMLDRMQTNRFKVFRTCTNWMSEKRLYHRKDGKIVKLMDDLISSTRYAVMMKRYAKQRPNAYGESVAETQRYNTDYKVF